MMIPWAVSALALTALLLAASAGAPEASVTCCVPWPIPGNETKAGCEAGGDARHDGGVYHWNTGRGTPKAACGPHASCDCCRTGPKSPVCDPPSPPAPPPAPPDTNTLVFAHGGSPSLCFVPPGARGAHPTNGTLLAFSGAEALSRSTSHGLTWSAATNPTASLPKWGWGGAQSVYDPQRQTVTLQYAPPPLTTFCSLPLPTPLFSAAGSGTSAL